MPVENNPPGKDDSNKIAKIIGKAANIANSAKHKKVQYMLCLCLSGLVIC